MDTPAIQSDAGVDARARRQTKRLLDNVAAGMLAGAAFGLPFSRWFLGAGLGAVLGLARSSWKNRKDDPPKDQVRATGPDALNALKAYTDGKMQRYTLLFAVNGGAFAVGQFLLKPEPGVEPILPIRYLADGAIIYTALMTLDIWLYGQMMREKFVGSAAFTAAGKALLLLLSLLLIGGWFLVAQGIR